MRTTVTLEPDVANDLKALAQERATTFKAVLNAVLRRGLSTYRAGGSGEGPFEVKPHHAGFRAGLDPTKLGQIADDLEVADFLAEAGDR